MKHFSLLILSLILFSCASHERKIATEDHLSEQEQKRQLGEFGSGYRN